MKLQQVPSQKGQPQSWTPHQSAAHQSRASASALSCCWLRCVPVPPWSPRPCPRRQTSATSGPAPVNKHELWLVNVLPRGLPATTTYITSKVTDGVKPQPTDRHGLSDRVIPLWWTRKTFRAQCAPWKKAQHPSLKARSGAQGVLLASEWCSSPVIGQSTLANEGQIASGWATRLHSGHPCGSGDGDALVLRLQRLYDEVHHE